MLQKIRTFLEEGETFTVEALEGRFRDLAEGEGVGAGQVVHPTRLALTGTSVGPGLFELMVLLGKEECLVRIGKACRWIDENGSPEIRTEA